MDEWEAQEQRRARMADAVASGLTGTEGDNPMVLAMVVCVVVTDNTGAQYMQTYTAPDQRTWTTRGLLLEALDDYAAASVVSRSRDSE